MSQQQKQLKILLVGDSCYDEYHFGTVNRISPEAPIPVLDIKNTILKKGMAANVQENILNLDVQVDFFTHYRERKHRYIDIKSNQQLLRVDELINKNQVTLLDNYEFFELYYGDYDAIVISDYNKGYISYECIDYIKKIYNGPIFIDSKKSDLNRLEGCFIKINQYEYETRTSDASNIIVTYGSSKVQYNYKEYFPPKVEAHDVCGAGDTFLAALAVEYIKTNNIDDAINFAMKAAAVTVQHIGVYAPKMVEINNDKT